MKIGIIQMSVSDNKQVNLENAYSKITECAKLGAKLIVLPEMFCCPYENAAFVKFAEKEGGEVYQLLKRAAKENKIFLIGGSMPEQDRDKIYNTSFVFDDSGTQIARHRKVHLFDIDIKNGQKFMESDTFSAGSNYTVFDADNIKIGLCICFDFRFPLLAYEMAKNGAEIIIIPAAFNMTTGPAHWELLFRQRAVDNQVFTVGVSSARNENASYVSYANSIVVSPWGTVLHRMNEKEDIVVVEINISEIEQIRQQLPLVNHYKEYK